MPMTRFITPEDFGARGDGTADDSIAFQALIDEWRKGEKPVYGDGTYRIDNIQWKGLIAAPATIDPDDTGPLVAGAKERRLKTFDLSNATVVNEKSGEPMFLHPVVINMTNTTIRIGSLLSGSVAGPIWKGEDTFKSGNGVNGNPPLKPGIVSHCTLDFGYIEFRNPAEYAFDCDFGTFDGNVPPNSTVQKVGPGTSFIDCRLIGNEWRGTSPEDGEEQKAFFYVRTKTATMNDNVFAPKRVVHRNAAYFFDIGCTGNSRSNFHNRFEGINFQTQVPHGQSGTAGGGLIALYGQRNFEISNCIVFDATEFNSDQILLSEIGGGTGCQTGTIRNYRRPNDDTNPVSGSDNVTLSMEKGVGPADDLYDIRIESGSDILIESCDCGSVSPLRVAEGSTVVDDDADKAIAGAKRINYLNTWRVNRFSLNQTAVPQTASLIAGDSATLIGTRVSAAQVLAADLKTTRFAINPAEDITIPTSGTVTVNASYINFTTGGDVTTIEKSGSQVFTDGERLTLTAVANVTVNLKDDNDTNSGNIRLKAGSTITLDSNNDAVELMYKGTLASWIPVSEAAQR